MPTAGRSEFSFAAGDRCVTWNARVADCLSICDRHQAAPDPATMIPMGNLAGETDAIRAIVKIIRNQKKLEKHQRATKASVETLQDSMVYAYDEIVEVIQPFMDDEGEAGAQLRGPAQ
jgi:hypothetical protein